MKKPTAMKNKPIAVPLKNFHFPDGSGIRPTVAAAPHWMVYPVELPKDGML